MNKKFFKVNLCNDELNMFDVICYYPRLSADLREAVQDRPIFEKCSEPLCIINCGITYDSALEIPSEVATKIIDNIKNNEELLEQYDNYLNEVERNSISLYNKKFNENKNIKVKKRNRK